MFTLAHLSDIHLSPMPRARRRELMSKRMLGYVNWHRGRKFVHRREILDLITSDIVEQKPDHIAVTGDLVNLGLPEEFLRAAEWLHHLGPPSKVTAIPGNHDAYVRLHPKAGTHHWRPYMESNAAGEQLFPTPPERFPFVRRFGDVALIALSSAIPDHAVHRRRQDRLGPARPAWQCPRPAETGGPVSRGADPPPSPAPPGRLASGLTRRRQVHAGC